MHIWETAISKTL